jgi:D-beta-D-heptose 7-phosphate kinase/D-beta-D-heptose 1-phosphate adenosyltransferase
VSFSTSQTPLSGVFSSVADDVIHMQKAKVFVLGDMILDTYISGKVQRISPEAPVPVVLEERAWAVLGGAANVAANVTAFGGDAWIAGRLGLDRDADAFIDIATKAGINASALVRSKALPTTRKMRVMAGYQQVVRIDNEVTSPLTGEDEESIYDSFKRFVAESGPKSLVISDYGKGVCSTKLISLLINLAKSQGISIITDPKSLDLKRYLGSTVIKPNLSEGREALKVQKPGVRFNSFDEEVEAVLAAVMTSSEASHVVLSLSEKGVIVSGRDLKEPIRYSSTALQVADVSGAGDTMVAFIAVGMASGLGIARSVQLANIAAGIVCSKLGTATVTASEFLESFKEETGETSPEKVVAAVELADILSQAQEQGKKVVFTNGCFDLLHVGHVDLLQKAKSLGDILVVALNTDASVKRLKGASRPLQNEEDRGRILASLAAVDYVTLFDEDTPLELITKLKPNVLVKGGDYTVATIVGAPEVQSWGGLVSIFPLVPGRSTTSLVERSKPKSK